MFILGNLLEAIATILGLALNVLSFILFVRCLISWVNPDPYNQIVLFLHKATDPLLREIRKAFPITMSSGIDWSPIFAFMLIIFTNIFLVETLRDIAKRL